MINVSYVFKVLCLVIKVKKKKKMIFMFLNFLEVYHIENISEKIQINRMQIDGVISVCIMKRQNV